MRTNIRLLEILRQFLLLHQSFGRILVSLVSETCRNKNCQHIYSYIKRCLAKLREDDAQGDGSHRNQARDASKGIELAVSDLLVELVLIILLPYLFQRSEIHDSRHKALYPLPTYQELAWTEFNPVTFLDGLCHHLHAIHESDVLRFQIGYLVSAVGIHRHVAMLTAYRLRHTSGSTKGLGLSAYGDL